MNESLKVVFGLAGGLALFLYGMTLMSDSLQKAAGEKMRRVLAALTKNPVLGVLSGALVTAVLQSSSATTVMAIGFVSAGLMTLPQAISIIFGANIGTTMTAQIIAFDIGDWLYPIIFIGFLIQFIAKKPKPKAIGSSILAFGLLFLGIQTMGDVMKPLAKSQFFLDLIARVSDNPILGLLTGLGMTLVVQSSSATIAVLQSFAEQAGPDGVSSIIGLAGAIPILLGDNIGTTITALLASIGQSRDAKRTALAHSIFNITGSILFLFLLKPYTSLIQMITPGAPETAVISRQIANAHTGFNLTMTLIWTPLLWLMVKIVMRILPDKKGETNVSLGQPVYLDNRLTSQPLPALRLVSQEILRASSIVHQILEEMREAPDGHVRSHLTEIRSGTKAVTSLNHAIESYITKLFTDGAMDETQTESAIAMNQVMNDINGISLVCAELCDNIEKMREEGKSYSLDALEELHHLSGQLLILYEDAIRDLTDGKTDTIARLEQEKAVMLKLEEKLRTAHMKRVVEGKCSVEMTGYYNSLLSYVERIGSTCISLAQNASSIDFTSAGFGGELETGL
jgi:phosphate:Na+ symporter